MDKGIYNGILIGILVISLALLFFSNVNAITGRAVTQTTSSKVTIIYYYAIDPSIYLEEGIVFEPVSELPFSNDNATHNYDGINNATQYYINVSDDSNTNVSFCILANSNLTDSSSGEEIPLVGETYSTNVTSSNSTVPALIETSMTTSYFEAASNVGVGEVSYWRFWLDIPAGQAAGNYNNTVQFAAIDAANENCPS
jgi:hypothetical protein